METSVSPVDVAEATDRLIESGKLSKAPYGVYVVRGDDPCAEVGRSVEREVFYDFFGNEPELLAAEYRLYEPASRFLCVVDHENRRPAGVFRILVRSAAGLKSFHDMEEGWDVAVPEVLAAAGIERGQFWDAATLAISADYRGDAAGGTVKLALCQALCMFAKRSDVPYLVSIMDVAIIELMQTFLGQPWKSFPGVEPRPYMGSPSSVPMYIDAYEYRARLAEQDEAAYKMLFLGHGTEDVIATQLSDQDSRLSGAWFGP